MEKIGVPGILLMENAGRGAAELLSRLYPSAEKFVIFCGPGNNGGDGFVAARHLLLAGRSPLVFITTAQASYKGDAAVAALCAKNCGVELTETQGLSAAALSDIMLSADVAVDALLGTGSKGAPRGEAARIIQLFEKARNVVSLDLPSGIDPDGGRSEGAFVRACATFTFLAEKAAFATEQGKEACGEIFVCHIGVPPRLVLNPEI